MHEMKEGEFENCWESNWDVIFAISPVEFEIGSERLK